ncbi:MAG: hypothetical protein QOI59_4603 [Gammaproteobacteria bacterium]|jgi:hypothetical protein|nr:hypothetical protein [Gammaproteobacteria bacterium]
MGTRRDQTGTNTREWLSALAIAGLIAGGYSHDDGFIDNVEPSYTTLNLRMGARFSGWDTALFVNNVTNDQAILNTKFVGFITFQAFNTPRTVGLNVRKEL